MELRNIARVLGRLLSTVQCHLKKLEEYKELYEEFIQKIKNIKLVFCYMLMDEIYTFVHKKEFIYG